MCGVQDQAAIFEEGLAMRGMSSAIVGSQLRPGANQGQEENGSTRSRSEYGRSVQDRYLDPVVYGTLCSSLSG